MVEQLDVEPFTTVMNKPRNFLFLVASTREAGHKGNTEWLAEQAATALPPEVQQTWVHLARMDVTPYVDLRHTVGHYPLPVGDLKQLLDQTMAATDIVLVAPVYWYSLPGTAKNYVENWSSWMRIPGVPFKQSMAEKTLHLICTSGDRVTAEPTVESVRLSAEFLHMRWSGVLWGKGGAPGAVQSDLSAQEAARVFFSGRVNRPDAPGSGLRNWALFH